MTPSTDQRPAPPSNRGRRFPAEPLTLPEIRALIRTPSPKAPTGIRNRALIATLYGAGLRLAETLALKPSDIDLEANTIRVLDGKGGKARSVAVDDAALAYIARWTDTRRARGIRTRRLFCTLSGDELSARYVRAMLARTAERAGIDKRVHPHGLRHTHAAELDREGWPTAAIQDQLGHTSLATTDRYLAHITPRDRIQRARGRKRDL